MEEKETLRQAEREKTPPRNRKGEKRPMRNKKASRKENFRGKKNSEHWERRDM